MPSSINVVFLQKTFWNALIFSRNVQSIDFPLQNIYKKFIIHFSKIIWII